MSTATLAIRIHPENLNHHIWNNNGTWFVHYTLHQPDFTKARIRGSLATRSVATARCKRDRLFDVLAVAPDACRGGGGRRLSR